MFPLNPNWMLNIPEFDEFVQQYSEHIKKIILKKEQVISKWNTSIKTNLGEEFKLSDDDISKISIYLEVCSNYFEVIQRLTNQSHELSRVFDKIRKDIRDNLNNRRSSVIRKVFNYQTGCMEYELEDGNFVRIDEKVTPPVINIDLNIFPKEFVKLIDPQKYRDMKINDIL